MFMYLDSIMVILLDMRSRTQAVLDALDGMPKEVSWNCCQDVIVGLVG